MRGEGERSGQCPYRDGVAHELALLEAERVRLEHEHRTLGRVSPRHRSEIAGLWASLEGPVASASDLEHTRAHLERLDAAMVSARLAASRSRARVRFVLCFVSGVVGVCVAGSRLPMTPGSEATNCANECLEHGQCERVDGSCIPTEVAHCALSEACTDWGKCDLVDRSCAPSSREHCSSSDGCRFERHCSLLYDTDGHAQCLTVEHISAPDDVPGKAPRFYRDREVARSHGRARF